MNKLPRLYLIFAALVMSVWVLYMLFSGNFSLYQTYWPAPVTMIFGSFIAGASSEGGGAVAFPVFTLLLNIAPSVARNFSFAIQSIGMTAASLLIIGLRIPVEWRAVRYTTPGGVIGLLLGTWLIVPHVPPGLTKLFFVSLWLSFGFALWLINRRPDRPVHDRIAGLTTADKWRLTGFGLIGGGITSLFGNGIDIFTFCLLTLFFRISEKVATPTSVVIMTINTIIGFAGHVLLWQDFGSEAFRYWLVSIPVALVFAPLGAWAISRMNRLSVAAILYTVMLVQYIGALFVIGPSAAQLLFSLLIISVGIFLFTRLTAHARPEQVTQ